MNLHSHQSQLIVTALAASAATAALISAYTAYSRETRRKELNEDVLKSIHAKGSNFNFQNSHDEEEDIELPSLGRTYDYDESLIREQLARNYAFFGESGMAQVRKGSVAVIGAGGVGSWAAVMLVRSYVDLLSIQFVLLFSLEGSPKSVWLTLIKSPFHL